MRMLAVDDFAEMRRKLESALADFIAGRIGEAAGAYRDILNQIPDQPDALHMLGAIAYRMGKIELALQLYEEAIRSVPGFALAWSNRGLLLRMLGRSDEALKSARKAISCDPKLADGWDIAGLILRERRLYAASFEHHLRARTLNPRNHHIQNNYAIALATLNRIEDAYHAARAAVALDPTYAVGYMTIANLLGSAGWPDRAIPYYRKAYTLDPALLKAAGSEGRALMLMGDMDDGWVKMDVREYDPARFTNIPRWNGEKVQHLLLYAEQGAGDIVHFLRYLPFLRGRAEKVTLEVPTSMRRFMMAQAPDYVVITPDDPVPAADALGFLMSLPHFSKTTLATIPAPISYIQAEEGWRAPWREKLAALPRPHIGIVWMGNPLYPNDENRSLRRHEIAPLWQAARPHLVSLQKGSTTATASDAFIFDADAGLRDFADTAGIIVELDLVIAADTGVAHFAGALGKPVWTLLPFSPDWRWLLGREDSPWYPSMRLFRQSQAKDWASVIDRVSAEMKKFIAGDVSVLKAPAWDGKTWRHHPQAIALPDEPPV